ncbi:hypothetical protein [Variovorax ginsengisoli]|uniref:Uncharacterized protein n=1 Tax=Variovorax ginsengisoli TaxID=363844 RepID=A0ABT8S176_9BURK|nr:hypothetical protein [Variovorax ginsengisoli]MDN8612794.1 hypothetical protein [Variovorax ginsengisoli]MDO1531964.1 hypothetical protein [Variovorax ginsengisoli]
MTVIAWDGKTLAADKRATSGGGIARTVTKICRGAAGELIAMTGDWDTAAEMREWFRAGADPEKFPAKAREDKATLIVITAERIDTYGCGPYPMPIENEQVAFGSGRDFAEAAMFLGHGAAEGVRVACHFQTDCGNGIDTLRFE